MKFKCYNNQIGQQCYWSSTLGSSQNSTNTWFAIINSISMNIQYLTLIILQIY